MENHIKNLYEATKNVEIFIASAYDWVDGKNVPSLAIRDRENKGCAIDGIFWLISGTVRSIFNHKSITNLNVLIDSVDTVYVDLRAQALIYGQFVQVELGNRTVISFEKAEDRIFAKLKVMEK